MVQIWLGYNHSIPADRTFTVTSLETIYSRPGCRKVLRLRRIRSYIDLKGQPALVCANENRREQHGHYRERPVRGCSHRRFPGGFNVRQHANPLAPDNILRPHQSRN
jgi:hypothetical protein